MTALADGGADDDAIARLLAGYSPADGVPDELIDPSGGIRPVWAPFIEALAEMPADALAARHARADQYLADAGVYYRQYGTPDASERAWPLSPMPVMIAEDEWEGIAAGLKQRADLLEAVCADIYGDNRLVAEGHLPAGLIADNPEWLRPLVGVTPRSGRHLHFVAFDIGRGPSGAWWVLSDRTQAPSGAGFALENRIATTRAYSETYSQANVHRLAGFFRRFRDTLVGLRQTRDNRIGIYTPGPMNDTYYEHAYIARYLGFQLLEGDDLTVRDGELLVRTIAGPKPVSVLWRRVDANWADPLELDERSTLGTPGMLGAVRAGNVTMVNALGAGVMETRAFLAFLPRICEVLTGAPLKLPNIATWWCGQPTERDYVKANADAMTIADAYQTRRLLASDDVAMPGGTPRPDAAIEAWLDEAGSRLVGQEAMTLSTTPAFDGTHLVPRPMSLRVFLARSGDGWEVMPGGFARIGRAKAAELSMQQGDRAADVWVVSNGPVGRETMLAAASDTFVREKASQLPSRAADSFYWLGRYVERTEHALRLARAYHVRLAEAARDEGPLLDYLREALAEDEETDVDAFPEAAAAALASAHHACAAIRDRFSVDGWNALNDLSRTMEQMDRHLAPGDDMARALGVLLRNLSGFSGLVHENMYRFLGWRFLSIGRSLERSLALTGLLATYADPEAPEGALDLAVEVADVVMTHRRRYPVATNRATVLDLLVLDPLNPRAVIYQINAIAEHVGHLPGSDALRPTSPLERAILAVRTDVALATPQSLDTPALLALENETAALSNHLAAAYLS
ncbi:MAG: circularly permuted type 2 ATP-grasp protein [Acuticoccus sp.]